MGVIVTMIVAVIVVMVVVVVVVVVMVVAVAVAFRLCHGLRRSNEASLILKKKSNQTNLERGG